MSSITCPQCHKLFAVPPTAGGKKATCSCGHRFQLPALEEVEFEGEEEEIEDPAKLRMSLNWVEVVANRLVEAVIMIVMAIATIALFFLVVWPTSLVVFVLVLILAQLWQIQTTLKN